MTQHVRQGPPKIYIWVPEQPGGNFATSKVVQIDISKNVLSFQCSKQMGQPAGSFQLTLLPVNIDGSGVGNIRDFDIFFRQVRPNSLVSIGFE
jgi:hypothetical protein